MWLSVWTLEQGANDLLKIQLMPLPPHYLAIDATATPSSLAPVKSRMVTGLPFWCRFTQVVLEKRPLNGCSSSSY